jgi:asparagine synthase (glutamine-hydrolysing)
MGDIFLSAGIEVDIDRVEKQLRWGSLTKTWSKKIEGLSLVAARVDDPVLWSPAYDPKSEMQVLIGGRIALEPVEWEKAKALQYEGGLAARHVLEVWRTGGLDALKNLNGGALIIVIDKRRRQAFVQTDRLGFYPFFGWSGSGVLLCSHPDSAADALDRVGRSCRFDTVTMAEFFRTGTAKHPHTYWHGIDHLDPASQYRLDFGNETKFTKIASYWRPGYFDGKYLSDRREIVDRLTTALARAVSLRTQPVLGKVAVLLSAGADSRAALFGACDPSETTGITMYDEPNAELVGALRLTGAAQAKHIAVQRNADYYIEHAAEAARVTGGMWNVESAHYGGLMPLFEEMQPGVVLTGCYVDYMLKGIAYDTSHLKLFGRAIPIQRLTGKLNYCWHHTHSTLAPKWHEHVDKRLQGRYRNLPKGCQARASAVEYERIAPIIREPDASGRLFLRRLSPLDLFVSDNEIVELFGLISPQEKKDGIPFGMAVDRICGPEARSINNNNYGAPVGAGEFQRVASFLKSSLRRKLTRAGSGQPYDRDPHSIATVGSWPHYGRVISRSSRLKQWRADLPRDQVEFVFGILGQGRENWSLDEWAQREPTLLFRAFTASLWLTQNSSALGNIREENCVN